MPGVEFWLSFGIYFFVGLIMIGIGRAQLRSKTPVAFYSGEKPLDADELSDVFQWNRRHGVMWVVYGIIIIVSGIIGGVIADEDSVWCLLPMLGGVLVPLVWMIWYHGKLLQTYKLHRKERK